MSDYSQRRHTDNDVERRDLSATKLEFTTQKLREEFAEKQDQLYEEIKEKFNLRLLDESQQFCPINEDSSKDGIIDGGESSNALEVGKDVIEKSDEKGLVKDENGKPLQSSKKKRRKKSMIKKKNSQRKNSTSSSASVTSDAIEQEDSTSVSNDASPNTENDIAKEVTLPHDDDVVILSNDNGNNEFTLKHDQLPSDIHFFSDGEIGNSAQQSRPNTPVKFKIIKYVKKF